ncbi:putative ABC transport system permease protein [Spirosoma lacussanchae]|uniref:ABC transporter permease n=1 Tax=Spirosoma lacussanchae TaxID=1884249 RepID=UPI001107B5BF|nr:ABC transporter permease [Spirosoma lacussanchae]
MIRKQPIPHIDHPSPPRWADRLLEWFVAPHLLEYVQGDLHETFHKQVDQVGLSRARRKYVLAVLHCLTPFFLKRRAVEPVKFGPQKADITCSDDRKYLNPVCMDMFSNYLIIALRNLWRQKAFSIITIFGLALGLATCLLIMFFVRHELSYDRYNTHADRIVRMTLHGRVGGKELNMAYAPAPAGPAMKLDYPGVEAFARLEKQGTFIVKHGQERFKEERVVFTDSTFFELFSIPLLKGDSRSVLTEPNTVVVTESTSRKYFGDQNPVGKSLTMGTMGLFRVTGVCQDVPSNSHFHFDFFGSYRSLPAREKWLASGANTYLLLRKDYSAEKLAALSPDIVRKYLGAEVQEFLGMSLAEFAKKGDRFGFGFQPLTTIHLGSDLEGELEPNSDEKYVYIFMAIAVFILLIACINYMNLSTAGSAGRAKEVGIRKALGSGQQQLVSQFLSESILITLLALLVAGGLVVLVLPTFNQLADKQFSLITLLDGRLIAYALAGCVVIGLLAGSYPAFFLASFRPVSVLKGRLQAGVRSGWLRSTLVTVQFVVSITMIISTLVVYQQLRFIQTKKVGFDKEQVLILHDTYVLGDKLTAFKKELEKLSSISSVSLAGYLPAGHSNKGVDGFRDVNAPAEQTPYRLKTYRIDDKYLTTLGIGLAAGRNFSSSFSDDSAAVLVNEAAVRQFGWKNPIGQRIASVGNGSPSDRHTYTVIGVTRNFHFESMHQPIAPLIMLYGGDSYQMALRTRTDNLPALLDQLERSWKAETDNPFAYSFLGERFNAMYQSEQRIGQLFGLFAGLAIAIACLGLFGLAAFTAYQRTKEIGVRKVLGASVPSIVLLLLTNYVKLILTALVVASPIAGYCMSQWLGDFAYKTRLEWWIFVVAGGLTTLVAVLTVSYQAIKAALVNPVKSLQTE